MAPHRHGKHERCDCQTVTVTVVIKDATGNVRAVRDGQALVRRHREHDWRFGQHHR